MKNITDTRPDLPLTGRLRYTTSFVSREDLKDKEVLDIGCGFGWFELHALRGQVARIDGIELTDGDLATARAHIRDERARFNQGSAIAIPFPESSFDTVVSWEVIEHIPKNTEDQMLQEARRVLREGGSFYLSTPFRSLASTLLDPAWWLAGHRHYSERRLKQFAQRNGFAVEQMVVKGSVWEIGLLWNLYIAKWIFRRPPFFESYFQRKVDAEYAREGGRFGIFVKLKKIG